MNEKTDRAAFEEWYQRFFGATFSRAKDSCGDYQDGNVGEGWATWQAALAHERAKSDWQPMASAPRDGTKILVCIEWDDVWIVAFWGSDPQVPKSRECWRCVWDHSDFESGFTPIRTWAWKHLGDKPPKAFGEPPK